MAVVDEERLWGASGVTGQYTDRCERAAKTPRREQRNPVKALRFAARAKGVARTNASMMDSGSKLLTMLLSVPDER